MIFAEERRKALLKYKEEHDKEEYVIFGISSPLSWAFALLCYSTCYLLRCTSIVG